MSISQIHAALRATDVSVWPAPLRDVAWALPVQSLELELHDEGLLIQDQVPEFAAQDLMPKLAIKSWRETGSLRMIAKGMPLLPAVRSLLVSLTWQQRFVLTAWRDADTPPLMHLLPWRDASRADEARFRVGKDGAQYLSKCIRRNGPRDEKTAQQLAELSHRSLGLDRSLVVQIAYGHDGQPYVIDVNPLLSRSELLMIETMSAA